MTREIAGGNGPAPALRASGEVCPLTPRLDSALPIAAHREEIVSALARHPVLIVCGATGSGKSTQLPQLCLSAGRGTAGAIGHTQPRRIAVRALATRLAAELGVTVGGAVGYQVRFEDRTRPDCRIKVMTDGILLRELKSDPELRRYDTLILDEVHERTLNIDLLLGVAKRLVARRSDLRVVITSATLDADKLAKFFDDAPVVEVSGRSFPVEVRYRPLTGEDEDAAELSLPEGIVAAVRELAEDPRTARGDVLVFLPGEKHIREAAEALRSARLPELDVLPLHARLTAAEQARIFEPHARRRVVLATNVAETSLTVPGIRAVIDSGLARLSRYSARGKVQRLAIEPISQASADQRKGRCGREAPGVCVRLYSQEDFERREPFTPPEILRTHLAGVILHMAACRLGEPEEFPFVDPPDTRLVNDGVRVLQELGAMTAERRVTRIGRQLAALPCDPRLGRMLIAAADRRALAEMLVIASFLAIQDPRERPADQEAQADARHAAVADRRSDFMTVLNLWRAFSEQAAALSRGELRKWCREQFLSFVRMREWQDLHAQLAEAVKEIGLARRGMALQLAPAGGARYADIHRAVLSGLLGSIGTLHERREYQGARGTRFLIAPGTPLAAKPPKWIVAASLTETTRLYARMVGAIEPAWIEAAAPHLSRRSYSGAHWDRKRGAVVAFESVSLYGLTLASQRRVSYGPLAPEEAHEIFIREGLVADGAGIRARFLDANRRLRAELERLEAKTRRRDIVAGEDAEVSFYRARIPRQVSSTAAFERWWIDAERRDPRCLDMSASDLLAREVPEAICERFPDALDIGGDRLPLEYAFEPGAANDGITLNVPASLRGQLDEGRLAWLVPGLREEKIAALLRALPKPIRKQLVPVPEHARLALEDLEREESACRESAPGGRISGAANEAGANEAGVARLPRADFFEWMARWITRRAGIEVSAAEVAALPLPVHLRLHIRFVETPAEEPIGADRLHRRWDFGDLPERRLVTRAGMHYHVYPAIADRGRGVERIEAASAGEAEACSRAGVARLAVLALPRQAKDLRRRIVEDRELTLLVQGLELARPLREAIVDRAFAECFAPVEAPLPRSRADFDARIDARRAALHEMADRVTEEIRTVLRGWRLVCAARARAAAFGAAVADIEAQLALLLPPDFIASTPEPWLAELPRYLAAIARRLDRLPGNERRDSELARRVAPFAAAWRKLAQQQTPLGPAAQRFRWMVEELRVSLFAQDLGTRMPVSEKRLAAELEALR